MADVALADATTPVKKKLVKVVKKTVKVAPEDDAAPMTVAAPISTTKEAPASHKRASTSPTSAPKRARTSASGIVTSSPSPVTPPQIIAAPAPVIARSVFGGRLLSVDRKMLCPGYLSSATGENHSTNSEDPCRGCQNPLRLHEHPQKDPARSKQRREQAGSSEAAAEAAYQRAAALHEEEAEDAN